MGQQINILFILYSKVRKVDQFLIAPHSTVCGISTFHIIKYNTYIYIERLKRASYIGHAHATFIKCQSKQIAITLHQSFNNLFM